MKRRPTYQGILLSYTDIDSMRVLWTTCCKADFGESSDTKRYFYHPELSCKPSAEGTRSLCRGAAESLVQSTNHLGSASWITDAQGQAIQHIQYCPYGEPFVNQQLPGTTYNERFTFTGKERDEETGYHYFGARYLDADWMTGWLSVDPLSDKYPSISPYNYCAWNPVKLVDIDGNEARIPPSTRKTICFSVRHPYIALHVGTIQPNHLYTNISTNSARFSVRDYVLKTTNDGNVKWDECSQVGAFRHALWQATITSYYGQDIAKAIGDAHENNSSANLSQRVYSSLADADQTADLLNNEIGRSIGDHNEGCSMNELAQLVLDEFYNNGLYTGKRNANGKWTVVKTKITQEQYNRLRDVFSGLDNNGFTPEEATLFKTQRDEIIHKAGEWIDNK